MIGILGILGFLLLIQGAMLVALNYLDNVEDIERKKLQKLVDERLD